MRSKIVLIIGFLLLVSSTLSCTQPVSQPVTAQSTPLGNSSQTGTQPVPQTKPTVLWKADGVVTSGEYSATNVYGDYSVSWVADDTYVYIAIKAKTIGWVAVGIQPGLTMKDADIIIGFVKDGKAVVTDQYSTGPLGPHLKDTELGGTDDILEYGGREEGGYTVIEFKRALKTGDKYDRTFVKGINKIIFSFCTSDDITSNHSTRGYGQIDLQ
jgi:hypothetical protein